MGKVIVSGGGSHFSVLHYQCFSSSLEIVSLVSTGTLVNLEHYLQALIH